MLGDYKSCFAEFSKDDEEDDDDVCDDITAENFNFCFNLCINSTMDTVDICVSAYHMHALLQPRFNPVL